MYHFDFVLRLNLYINRCKMTREFFWDNFKDCSWSTSRVIDEKRVEKLSTQFCRPMASEKAVFTADSEFDQTCGYCYPRLPVCVDQVSERSEQYFSRKSLLQVKQIVDWHWTRKNCRFIIILIYYLIF